MDPIEDGRPEFKLYRGPKSHAPTPEPLDHRPKPWPIIITFGIVAGAFILMWLFC